MAGWLALAVPKQTAGVYLNRREMAGIWLGGWHQRVSKPCGCDSRSLQDGWEMIGWLAPTSSKDCGCNCRSPRDGWEMAGWLALAISKDFMCNVGSLGDGWEMAGRAPVVLEHQIQSNDRQYNTKHTVHIIT